MTRQLSNQTQQQTLTTSPLSSGILQRKCVSCGQHTVAGGECEGCQKKRLSLQRTSTSQAEPSVRTIGYDEPNSPGFSLDPATHAFRSPKFGYNFARVGIHSPGYTSECAFPAPASIASTLTTQNGQPLPNTLQTSAEERFGHPFAHVRLHMGSEAHRMARMVHARAFTFDNHIVFGAGQYIPETSVGLHLLWHELGHVATPTESNTQVLRAPLYDLTSWNISAPSRGHTGKSMRDLLNQKISKKPPDITRAEVKNVLPGSEAEIFLMNILWALGKRDRWGTVVKLETAIGWEKLVSANTGIIPTGLVVVTIDDLGNATAELIQAAPLALPTTMAAADATTKLQTDYGATVAAGDKQWSNSELSDVVSAFALLPASDHAALKGVHLLRFTTLPKNHAGEFNRGGGVAMGATTVTSPPTLKLADSAFSNQANFLGDTTNQAPASFQTILHEVGHAVEKQVTRTAAEELGAATIKQNKAGDALNTVIAKWKQAAAAGKDITALKADYAAKKKVYDTTVAGVRKKQAAFDATRVSSSVVAPLVTAANAKKTGLSAALSTANAAVKGYSPQELSDSADYRIKIDTVKTVLDEYEKKSAPGNDTDLDVLDDTLLVTIAARNTARDALKKVAKNNSALTDFSPVEAAQDEWADALRTLAHTKGQTLRLQKFVTVVNTAKITPFTKYARDNWPYKPEEFYAEAYSLWLTDPTFVKTNYKPIFDFFDSGDYLK